MSPYIPIVSNLCGQLLVATPQMSDDRFHRAVIYMCQHDSDSAMGLIINQQMDDVTFDDLVEKLELETMRPTEARPVFQGGPVEPRRGYILHSQDQMMPDSIAISEEIGLSLHVDMLQDIAHGLGPLQAKIMLGYTGWSAGQLEAEMRENMWFHLPAITDLIFTEDCSHMWELSLQLAGVNAGSLSPMAGNA